MTEYEVLGGHDVAEFRRTEEEIVLHSTEENPKTGEEIGHIGTLTEDELSEAGEVLDRVQSGEADGVEAPEMDDVAMRQHAIFGWIVFLATDDEGEIDDGKGAVFSPDEIIEAADSLE